MRVPLIKLHSGGADYLVVDSRKLPKPGLLDPGRLAGLSLPRRVGIGATALLWLDYTEPQITVGAITSQGRAIQVNGDALFCAARYVFDSGDSRSGQVELRANGKQVALQVLAGGEFRQILPKARRFIPGQGPGTPSENLGESRLVVDMGRRRVSVSLIAIRRNWAVILSDRWSSADFKGIRQSLASQVGSSANELAIKSVSHDCLAMVQAKTCPDGCEAAAAALVTANLAGLCDREALIMRGPYPRYVDWDRRDGVLAVVANADYVVEAEWEYDVDRPQAPE